MPDVADALDPAFGIVALDKEIFTDVTSGDKHEGDVLMRARFRGQDTFFLIHVENQSTTQSDFPRTLVARQLRHRFGAAPAEVTTRLDQLSPDQLDDLGEALLDFAALDDLEQWLARL